MNVKRWSLLIVGVLVLTGSAVAASAADDPRLAPAVAGPDSERWHFTIPVGYYSFGMNGTSGFKDVTSDFSINAAGVSDKLDMAAGFAFEAEKGRWAILPTISYLKFQQDPRPGTLPDSTPIMFQPTMKWTTFGLAGAYRAVLKDPGPTMFSFSPTFGVRYTTLNGKIRVTEIPEIGAAAREDSVNWADAFVGFRMAKLFSEHWVWKLDADYGYGISGNSNPSWNASTAFGYRMPMSWGAMVLAVGYKAGGVKYENKEENPGNFRMDVTMSGPTLGMSFSW